MIPRRKKRCWVEFFSDVTYYKPAGIPLEDLEEITLTVEELEAIRLKDLEGLDQKQCACQMDIARTTFQRLLYAAHTKVAEALVHGKALKIEGGNYEMPSSRRFKCTICGHEFEVPFGNGQRGRDMICSGCGKGPVCRIGSRGNDGHGGQRGPGSGAGGSSSGAGTIE